MESRVPMWAKVMTGLTGGMWMYFFIRLSWKIKKLKVKYYNKKWSLKEVDFVKR